MADSTDNDDLELPEFDAGASPNLQIVTQYLKDLSFENYNAPQSLVHSEAPPEIEVSVNLDAQNVGEKLFEIELTITATADREDERIFLVEAVYGGLFQVQNISEQATRLVCLIECPRLLFPFVRRIIADATRDGGFPPLLIEPIDFYRLYRERQANPENAGATEDDGEDTASP